MVELAKLSIIALQTATQKPLLSFFKNVLES